MDPIKIDIVYTPLMPSADTVRKDRFRSDEYSIDWSETFEQVAQELVELSVALLRLLPDPSLSPDERLERLARVVPNSQLVSANRRTARSKLEDIRRRLDQLVPEAGLTYTEKLNWLVERLNELVPGDQRPIEKLEQLGDYRSTDIGVSPRHWR